MSKAHLQPELSFDPALMPIFKIFTVYENPDAYAQALKIQGHLESLCKNEMRIVSLALNFSLFREEKSWKSAAVEAAKADVIIISASGEGELLAAVQGWAKNWPRREQAGQAALVVTFDPEQESDVQQSSLTAYFRWIAENSGLDFFCNRIFGMA